MGKKITNLESMLVLCRDAVTWNNFITCRTRYSNKYSWRASLWPPWELTLSNHWKQSIMKLFVFCLTFCWNLVLNILLSNNIWSTFTVGVLKAVVYRGITRCQCMSLSQGISSRGIDHFLLEYSGLSRAKYHGVLWPFYPSSGIEN